MNTVNPIEIVNQSKLKGFHYILILCLFFIMMFDGYDVVIYGATIPLLKAEWGITDIVAGSISSYTTIGTAIGAVLFGLYADRFGKKRIIIFTTFLLSFFTLLSGFAPTPIFFIICRIIAGLGFGGVMPNIAALISEYAPSKIPCCHYFVYFLRLFRWCDDWHRLADKYFSKNSVGNQFTGLVDYHCFCYQLLLRILPESISSLMKQKDTKGLFNVLRKIEPMLSKDVQFTYVEQEQLQKSSVRDLFKNKLGLSTMMFWFSCFCTFILMYSLNTWLPTLMMNAGYNLKSSLTFVAVLQIGSIIGTLVFGNLIQLLGFKRVLIPLYIVGAISLVLIGYSTKYLYCIRANCTYWCCFSWFTKHVECIRSGVLFSRCSSNGTW